MENSKNSKKQNSEDILEAKNILQNMLDAGVYTQVDGDIVEIQTKKGIFCFKVNYQTKETTYISEGIQ